MCRVRLLTVGALAVAFILGATAAGVVGAIAAYVPNRDRVYDPPNQATRLYARDGQLVASFYRENREFTTILEGSQRRDRPRRER